MNEVDKLRRDATSSMVAYTVARICEDILESMEEDGCDEQAMSDFGVYSRIAIPIVMSFVGLAYDFFNEGLFDLLRTVDGKCESYNDFVRELIVTAIHDAEDVYETVLDEYNNAIWNALSDEAKRRISESTGVPVDELHDVIRTSGIGTCIPENADVCVTMAL